MTIIYYILSILSIFFFVISVQFKKKENILFVQYLSSVCYMIIYFIKGAYTGAITEFVEQAKNIIFIKYIKEDKDIPLIALIIFILILVIITIVTYDGLSSLLPLLIYILYFVSSYMKNPKHIRIMMIVCAIIWAIFNYSIGAYIIIIGNLLEIISATISLIRFKETK